MTCYLTDGIDPGEVERGFTEGVFAACKLYPAHATTNSSHGVTDIRKLTDLLETMQSIGMPLLIHQHHGDPAIICAIGMLAGFCGTLMTPMAANFNLVPAALLELKDQNGVIKAQVGTAGSLVNFCHPKDCGGVLVELVQAAPEAHRRETWARLVHNPADPANPAEPQT